MLIRPAGRRTVGCLAKTRSRLRIPARIWESCFPIGDRFASHEPGTPAASSIYFLPGRSFPGNLAERSTRGRRTSACPFRYDQPPRRRSPEAELSVLPLGGISNCLSSDERFNLWKSFNSNAGRARQIYTSSSPLLPSRSQSVYLPCDA